MSETRYERLRRNLERVRGDQIRRKATIEAIEEEHTRTLKNTEEETELSFEDSNEIKEKIEEIKPDVNADIELGEKLLKEIGEYK